MEFPAPPNLAHSSTSPLHVGLLRRPSILSPPLSTPRNSAPVASWFPPQNLPPKDATSTSSGSAQTERTTSRNAPASRFRRKTLFLLDVPPLCYIGKKPQPSALMGWMESLFSDVTANEPVIAVMDGERGNEYRRRLLPTYKVNRNTFVPLSSSTNRQTWKGDDADLREAFPHIRVFLEDCHIPIASMEDAEADDVVASLTKQAVEKGMQVIIASPDKDFKQLLCDNVQIVAPLADLGRWSFYTHKQYIAQHSCDPDIELSLRCMLGDKADCIPGLAELAPGFGRNTALKLMKKHGSLENLLIAASTRTVGKPYVQNALTEHASFLWRNLELLRLRWDVPVLLKEEWCTARDSSNDQKAFAKLAQQLKNLQRQRALKDGVRTASFSDRKAIEGIKHRTINLLQKTPKK